MPPFKKGLQQKRLHGQRTTEGPMWGHPRFVLGTIVSFLEPFRGYLSPNIDKVSEKLTLRYPHEGPCVDAGPRSQRPASEV